MGLVRNALCGVVSRRRADTLEIEDENLSQSEHVKLSDLLPGEEAVILLVRAKGPIRRRLLEMGFIRGAHLRVEKLAPLGDPMELIIKGYHLSIRREEGECIVVERCRAAHPQAHCHPDPLMGRMHRWMKRFLTIRAARRP